MAASSSVEQSNWSDIPPEILELILEKLGAVSMEDIRRFKAVCGRWRKAAKSYIYSPFPWLMLLEDKDDTKPQSFYSIEERKTYELKNMSDSYTGHWVVVGSSCGWLVIYEPKTVLRYDLSLFNPCSRVKILLPSVENLLLPSNPCFGYITRHMLFSTKAILLSDPSRTKNWRVVAVSSYMPSTRLVIYINGSTSISESKWIEFGYQFFYEDILWNNGKLYTLMYGGKVHIWEFEDNNLIPTKVASLTNKDLYYCGRTCHLVGSLDDVLFVAQPDVDMPYYHKPIFYVYKLDYSGKKWEKLKNLGDRILFLTTDRTSMSVSAPNSSKFHQKYSIYFLYRMPTEMVYAGVYNLEGEVLTSFYHSVSSYTSPLGKINGRISSTPNNQPRRPCNALNTFLRHFIPIFIPILHLGLWFFN